MLANELAKSIAHGTAAAVTVGRLWRQLLRLSGWFKWFGKRADLFDRADPDSVGLAESTIHSPRLCHAHFGSVNLERDIGGIGVAITDKFLISRLNNRCLEDPTALFGTGNAFRQFRHNALAASPLRD